VTVKVVAVTCKKRFETLKPANVWRAVEPVDGTCLLGHGRRCLELDAGYVTPELRHLSAADPTIRLVENYGLMLQGAAYSF
jgi:hypothetical protein